MIAIAKIMGVDERMTTLQINGLIIFLAMIFCYVAAATMAAILYFLGIADQKTAISIFWIFSIGLFIILMTMMCAINLSDIFTKGKSKPMEKRIKCEKHGRIFKQDIHGAMYCPKCNPEHDKEFGGDKK